MGEPPWLAGGVNDTVAAPIPGVAVPIVGAPGTVRGVTGFDGADWGPLPAMLVACTVKV